MDARGLDLGILRVGEINIRVSPNNEKVRCQILGETILKLCFSEAC